MEDYGNIKACRKCLISEMAQEDLAAGLNEYISRISDDIRTPHEEYERRLLICKNCDSLISGMCMRCGCYVELRAAAKSNYCPDINKKW